MPEPIEKSVGSYNIIYIDRVDISKIENGNANPSLKNIKREVILVFLCKFKNFLIL